MKIVQKLTNRRAQSYLQRFVDTGNSKYLVVRCLPPTGQRCVLLFHQNNSITLVVIAHEISNVQIIFGCNDDFVGEVTTIDETSVGWDC